MKSRFITKLFLFPFLITSFYTIILHAACIIFASFFFLVPFFFFSTLSPPSETPKYCFFMLWEGQRKRRGPCKNKSCKILKFSSYSVASNILSANYNPYLIFVLTHLNKRYSNSIVPGGLLVRSYITLLTPFTSLIILFMTPCNTAQGISALSAVIKSIVFTARSATA